MRLPCRVDSVKHAAELLASTNCAAFAAPLLDTLGFTEKALPLDSGAQADLALHQSITSAHVARGEGALRALILEATGTASTRELVQHSCLTLSVKVPHLLWIVVTLHQTAREISLACWESGGRHPRVVALIASHDRVLESDADTLCSLADARSPSDILTHARWLELLGREAITRRFFRSLRDVVDLLAGELPTPMTLADRRELAILTVSRLLFLSFLETKGWLDGDFDFLANQFARCMTRGSGYHRRVLHPLFFGTLNTRVSRRAERARDFGKIPFLNGGLFTRSHLERRWDTAVFSDEGLSEVFSRLLTSFRFSAREDTQTWSETAVDPEILGKAFEALMAADDRKTSGAFYTPQRLVEHVTESALVAFLSPNVDREVLRALLSAGQIPEPATRELLLGRTTDLQMLDPACGSGAFLVHGLEKLTELRLRLGEIGSAAVIRRKTLAASIFGVDVNPMAVWLCQLRLWLAIVIDSTDPDPMHVVPLPNLDRQIRVGDSLAGGSFTAQRWQSQGRKLALLRGRYMRSTGSRKKTLARQLDREERSEAIEDLTQLRARLHYQRREIIIGSRSPDLFGGRASPGAATLENLRSLRRAARAAAARQRRLKSGAALPFSFSVHFADVAGKGGFDVIVGNPPWVRIHNIGAAARIALHRDFTSFSRSAWRAGAELAGSGHAFASQIDLSALFVERSTFLLRENGALALLLPAKLWRSLSGGGVREVVLKNLDLVAIEDMTESRSGFDAAVYPSLLVGRRLVAREIATDSRFAAAVHRHGSVLQWEMESCRLSLDDTPGSPWLLMPPEVRSAFDALSETGTPLGMSHIGRPMLGVKTGCNSAFILDEAECGESKIESSLLRPVIRGETLTRWKFDESPERIVWTHSANGPPLNSLPAGAQQWLSKWRSTLERRTDNHGASRWWTLFRTEGASPRHWRVIWCDFGKAPRACVLPAGSDVVPLNTCYVARCQSREDALALSAILNGPLLACWLNAIAEPARGGYRRYLGWTVSLMPLPRDWQRAIEILAPMTEQALEGIIPSQCDLLTASLSAYRLRRADVEALISWTKRS